MVNNHGPGPNGQEPTSASEVGSSLPASMGVPAEITHPALQTDAFKEIVNKLAWALGTTYRVPYSTPKSVCRQWALSLAKATVTHHGYPSKIEQKG